MELWGHFTYTCLARVLLRNGMQVTVQKECRSAAQFVRTQVCCSLNSVPCVKALAGKDIRPGTVQARKQSGPGCCCSACSVPAPRGSSQLKKWMSFHCSSLDDSAGKKAPSWIGKTSHRVTLGCPGGVHEPLHLTTAGGKSRMRLHVHRTNGLDLVWGLQARYHIFGQGH